MSNRRAVDPEVAAQIRGDVAPEAVGQAGHLITPGERTMALDVAGALALEHGSDLAAHVVAHQAQLAQWDAEHEAAGSLCADLDDYPDTYEWP